MLNEETFQTAWSNTDVEQAEVAGFYHSRNSLTRQKNEYRWHEAKGSRLFGGQEKHSQSTGTEWNKFKSSLMKHAHQNVLVKPISFIMII